MAKRSKKESGLVGYPPPSGSDAGPRLVGPVLWRRAASLRAFYAAIRRLKALRLVDKNQPLRRGESCAPHMKKPGAEDRPGEQR